MNLCSSCLISRLLSGFSATLLRLLSEADIHITAGRHSLTNNSSILFSSEVLHRCSAEIRKSKIVMFGTNYLDMDIFTTH